MIDSWYCGIISVNHNGTCKYATQSQRQRSRQTKRSNHARRDPMAQAQARAAALEAAGNRANKFDNLVNKKRKKGKA